MRIAILTMICSLLYVGLAQADGKLKKRTTSETAPPPTELTAEETDGKGCVGPVTPQRRFLDRLKGKTGSHNCGIDGCQSPLGCGTFHTEFKFLFGSCRQFFGTGTAAQGHGKNPYIP